MILHALKTSLIITAIYMVFQEGMILGWFRIMMANICDKYLGKKRSLYLQKPVWGCLTCMSGIWTVLLSLRIDIPLIFIVCGLCAIIDKFLNDETKVVG